MMSRKMHFLLTRIDQDPLHLISEIRSNSNSRNDLADLEGSPKKL